MHSSAPVPNNNNNNVIHHVYYHVSSGNDANTINSINNNLLGIMNQSLQWGMPPMLGMGMGAWGMPPMLGMGMGAWGMPPMLGAPNPMNLGAGAAVDPTNLNLLGTPPMHHPLRLGTTQISTIPELCSGPKVSSETGEGSLTIPTARQQNNNNTNGKCMGCGINRATVVLLPCKHLCVCRACVRGLRACPRCKHGVVDAVEVYQ